MHKYSQNINCSMSNYNHTCLAIFGMLLIVTVASSSSTLLFPVTKIVSATPTSGSNETSTSSNNMTEATFLFIQDAQSGSVSEVNDTTSTLELSDVSDKTILFSDRPDRIVASIDTADFIGNWSTEPNSFAVDPPNAALVVDDDVEQRQDLGVIELFNPEYDAEANTLRYDIVSENGTSIGGLPGEFGQSTLVIDPHFVIPPMVIRKIITMSWCPYLEYI
jgi:hypothetical protein